MRHFLVVLFLIVSFFTGSFSVFAQTAELTPAQRAALERQLSQIESEIRDQQNILDQKKTEGQSISRDIAILDAKIKQAQLKIKAHNLAIDKLGKDITVKVKTIGTLEQRIDAGHQSLGDIVSKTNELDSYSIVEAFLAKKNFSEFFIDFDNLASLQDSLDSFLNDVKQAKNQNETEKDSLNQKRNQEIDTRINVETEQKKIKQNEAEKQQLLNLNKQQQKGYQAVISDKQKKAADIRNALFPLRDAAAIKFEDALAYAKAASAVTGVRAAFILAILQQESNFGANVGQCYLKDSSSGSGVGKNTGTIFSKVMSPTRDVPPFLDLAKRLGFDPYKQVVSCPQSVGWGGAMGPAQFIPSTWSGLESKIASALGKTTPNPWAPRDAIMANAIFVDELGAGKGGYSAEYEAAGRYYAGGGWKTLGAGYAKSVLSRAQKIQDNIDILQQ